MKLAKSKLLFGGALLVIMASSAVLTGFFFGRNESTTAQQQTVNPNIVMVDLFEDSVSPDTLTIKKGQTVQVNNKSDGARELSLGSGTSHSDNEISNHEKNETSDDVKETEHEEVKSHNHQEGFSSGLFESDEAWQATFNEVGTFFLHDHENPDINILVVVFNES